MVAALPCAIHAGSRSALAMVAALPLVVGLSTSCAIGAGLTRSAHVRAIGAGFTRSALALVAALFTDVIMTVTCDITDVIGKNVVLHSFFVPVVTMTVIEIVMSAMSDVTGSIEECLTGQGALRGAFSGTEGC